jgi:carboxymethylenebutenolidase
MKKGLSDDNKSKTNRRDFLKKTVALTGVSVLGLYGLSVQTFGIIIEPDDARLITETIDYKGETGRVLAYLARPNDKRKYPAVIVIHENKGLQPHIKDVARRIALEGFVAIAPDALSPQGGTPEKPEEAGPLFQKMDYEATKKDFTAAVAYLKTNPLTTGKVGCTGFCWGGAMVSIR